MKTLHSPAAFGLASLLLTAAALAQPANDNCANAIPVANHSSTTFDLTGATRDGLMSCNTLATSADIWFTYTAAGAETVTVDLCGSSTATKSITAFAGGCGSQELACSLSSFCGTGQPRIIFNAPSAGTYLLGVARRGSSTALAGVLNVNAVPFVAPPGDTCADAITIAGPGSYTFDSTTAASDGPSASCNVNGRPDAHDLYFKYTPTADAWVRFDTLQNAVNPGANPTLNTTIQVFDSCGGSVLACNDDVDYTGAAFGLRVGSRTCPVHVLAGSTYIVRVASSGAGAAGGLGKLRLSTVSGPITYAAPANALPEPGPECEDDWSSDVNFGCNSRVTPTELRSLPIPLCSTYKGHIYQRFTPISDGTLIHDFDSYHIILNAADTIRVRGQAQFVGVVTFLSLPCSTGTLYTGQPDQDMNPECGAADFDLTWTLPAGEYLLGFGVAPTNRPLCGQNNEYWFTITGSAPCATGTCCRGATCSTSVAQADCSVTSGLAGAAFVSSTSTCNTAPTANTPCCYADYNKLGGITVNDIFDFLADWFAGSPFAATGSSGAPATLSVQNIFDFLAAWFAGGCS